VLLSAVAFSWEGSTKQALPLACPSRYSGQAQALELCLFEVRLGDQSATYQVQQMAVCNPLPFRSVLGLVIVSLRRLGDFFEVYLLVEVEWRPAILVDQTAFLAFSWAWHLVILALAGAPWIGLCMKARGGKERSPHFEHPDCAFDLEPRPQQCVLSYC